MSWERVGIGDPGLEDGLVLLRDWADTDAAWYAQSVRDPLIQRFTTESPELDAGQVLAAMARLRSSGGRLLRRPTGLVALLRNMEQQGQSSASTLSDCRDPWRAQLEALAIQSVHGVEGSNHPGAVSVMPEQGPASLS